MAYYDDKLCVLREKVSRKKRADSKLAELRKQHQRLKEKEARLRDIMLSEQTDVDRLEGGSLAAFFYNVIGRMDEKLTKEREEAYAARVKHDAAVSELRLIECDIASLEGEADELRGCEEELEQVLREKKQAIKNSGNAAGEEIILLEVQMNEFASQLREIREAMLAGELAADIARDISASLDDAEGWGTFDLIGGGLVADIAKHSILNDAQTMVQSLQNALRKFNTELTDVRIDANLKVNIDGFLGFADFFFDGIFADWAALDRITTAQGQVQNVRDKINNLLRDLRMMERDIENKQNAANRKLQSVILETQM